MVLVILVVFFFWEVVEVCCGRVIVLSVLWFIFEWFVKGSLLRGMVVIGIMY